MNRIDIFLRGQDGGSTTLSFRKFYRREKDNATAAVKQTAKHRD